MDTFFFLDHKETPPEEKTVTKVTPVIKYLKDSTGPLSIVSMTIFVTFRTLSSEAIDGINQTTPKYTPLQYLLKTSMTYPIFDLSMCNSQIPVGTIPIY